MERGYCYNFKENKIVVSTKTTFLGQSIVNDFKPQSRMVVEKMSSNTIVSTISLEIEPIIIEKETQQQPWELQRSERIRLEPNRLMAN